MQIDASGIYFSYYMDHSICVGLRASQSMNLCLFGYFLLDDGERSKS